MKKLLLFIFALFLWTGAWAQGLVNHAYGLTPTVLSASNTPDAEHLAYLTDGDFGMSYGEGEKSAAFGNTNPTIFYYDLGSSKSVGRISISWTGAHARNYKIYAVNKAPDDAEAASALTGEIVDATNVSVPAGANKTVNHDATATARYIVFVATAFDYGCTMHEFAVFSEAYEHQFTSIVPNNGTYIYNAAQEVTLTLLDQAGASYEGEVTSMSFTNADYGYATNYAKPSFTFGADFPSAIDDLSIRAGGTTVSKGFGFLKSAPDNSVIPAIDSETSYIIFSAEKNERHEVNNTYDGDNTSVISNFSIDGHDAELAKKMRYVFFRNNTFNPSKTDMTSLVLDIFVTEPHAKENCHIKAEGKGSVDFPQDLIKGWNHVVLTNFNPSTLAGLTSNTSLFVRIDDAEEENVVIYNLYYSTVSAAKSVTFTNDAGWDNVYVWAWKGTEGQSGYENFTGGVWPGEKLTDNDDKFTWTTTGDPEKIIFNNGEGGETATFAFVDGATYDSNGIPAKRGYYIVGTMNDWTLGDEYKMKKNDAQTEYNEYMFEQLSLTSSNELKINYSADGVIKSDSYFPNDNITGLEGPYNVYFCPEGGRYGWINGSVYMQQTYNVVVDGNNATVTGVINAGNLDAIKAAVGMSTYVDVSGATLETYFSTDNPNALYLYATNEAAAAATNTPNPVFKADIRFYSAPKGVIFTDAPAVSDIPKNAFSGLGSTHKFVINRTIAGNSYVTSFMKHAVTSGNQNMTATLADGLEAYELTAAEAGQLTFTKVTGDLVNDKGYVIHNTTSDPLTMTWDSNSNDQVYIDYANNQDPATVEAIGGVKILGTMQTVTTDGNQWILSGGQIMQANGAKITAYRAYFTGVTLPASGKASAVFVDGETTKIGSINANGEINVENGAVYNLAGQRVAHPTKGLYIVNGKKVIIK